MPSRAQSTSTAKVDSTQTAPSAQDTPRRDPRPDPRPPGSPIALRDKPCRLAGRRAWPATHRRTVSNHTRTAAAASSATWRGPRSSRAATAWGIGRRQASYSLGGADGHLHVRAHGPVPKADVHVIVDDRLRRVRDRVGDLLDPGHRVLADGRQEVGDIGMGRIDQRLEQSTLRMRAPAGGGQPRSHVRVGMAATAQVERLGDLRPR